MIKNKKIVITSIVITAVIAASAVTLLTLFNKKDDSPNIAPTDSSGTTAQDQTGTNGTVPTENKTIIPSPTSTTSPEDPGTLPEKPSVTRAEQSGDSIRVSAIFTKSSTGTCLLLLEKKDSPSVTKSANIVVGPSYYACDGFKVPRTELGSAGEWSATITHQLDGKITASDTKTITIQ